MEQGSVVCLKVLLLGMVSLWWRHHREPNSKAYIIYDQGAQLRAMESATRIRCKT